MKITLDIRRGELWQDDLCRRMYVGDIYFLTNRRFPI